ncbi:MAG: multicopper oxidase domain-containing protein [Nitrososphaeraceae archaeon]|jgi:nitrite reductase (NO-forming)
MNKVVIVGVVIGVLLAGLIFSPVLTGKFAQQAQAQASTGKTKKVLLVASEKEVQVAPDNALHPGGVKYNAMVFNGTIPGPVIAIDQGDTLEVTLRNDGKLVHSMDFHAGFGADKANSGPVKPGESKTWTLQGVYSGVFFYHCSADALNGIWEHIANGMYGGIVVHPTNEQQAKEFYVVFGEIYNTKDKGLFQAVNGTGSFDIAKFATDQADLELTNGMAFKYAPAIGQVVKLELNKNAEVFKVKPGELTRWYIVNGGPNDFLSFHIIGGIITVRDGSVGGDFGTVDQNDETWTIPPGSASVIESVFPSPGLYVGVTHSLAGVVKGGAFAVLAVDNSTATDHPAGTWVPPKGSSSVAPPASGMPPATSGSNQTAAAGGGGASSNQTAAPTAAEGGGGSATGIPGM